MLRKLFLLRHAPHSLASVGLVLLGFWLFPEDPGFPSLLLVAVAAPAAILLALVAFALDRRAAARARTADACYEQAYPD